MSEYPYAKLRAHDRRVAGMLSDPECVGELLLVGIAMARSVDLGDPGWGDDGAMPMGVIAERVYGKHQMPARMMHPDHHLSDARPSGRIWALFRADRRRYEPEGYGGLLARCGRPMVRREGTCGRGASRWKQLTDPTNGLRTWVGCCSQKACRRWYDDLLACNAAELAEHPPPVPAANTGGVLERHLPEIDWWKVWRAVDPQWTPPPEGRPFERPTLTLLVGDDVSEVRPAGDRPSLTVIEGGRR